MQKKKRSTRRVPLESSSRNHSMFLSEEPKNRMNHSGSEEPKQKKRSPMRRSEKSKALSNPNVDAKRSREAMRRKRRIESCENEITITEPPKKKKKRKNDSNGNNNSNTNNEYNNETTNKDKGQIYGYEIKQREGDDLNSETKRNHKQLSNLKKFNSLAKKVSQNTVKVAHDGDSNFSAEDSVGESLYDRLMNRESWITKSSSFREPMDRCATEMRPENAETLKSSNDVEREEPQSNQTSKDSDTENLETQDVSSDRNSEQNTNIMDVQGKDCKLSMRHDDNTFELDVDAVNEAEEGASDNWEVSSDFDGEDDALLLAMKAQQKRYMEAAASNSQDSVRGHLLRTGNGMISAWDSPMRGPLNMKEEWYLEYQRKPPLYFKSREAKMEVDQKVVETSTGQHKATSYSGVKLNEKNNADVPFVFNREFETTNQADRSTWNTYSNFKTCIGELARVGIALGKLSLEDFWRPGEFFQIA